MPRDALDQDLPGQRRIPLPAWRRRGEGQRSVCRICELQTWFSFFASFHARSSWLCNRSHYLGHLLLDTSNRYLQCAYIAASGSGPASMKSVCGRGSKPMPRSRFSGCWGLARRRHSIQSKVQARNEAGTYRLKSLLARIFNRPSKWLVSAGMSCPSICLKSLLTQSSTMEPTGCA